MAKVFFMLDTGPVVGKVFDDYFSSLILLSRTLLQVFGLMMASMSTEYYQLLLSQAICSGIGAGMVFCPASSCVTP